MRKAFGGVSRLFILAAVLLMVPSCHTKSKIIDSHREEGPSSDAIVLRAPQGIGYGLLDGSGDEGKALDPIKEMTTCSSGGQSYLPKRIVRLTAVQLENTITQILGSAPDLKTLDIGNASNSNFKENSYTLLTDEQFVKGYLYQIATFTKSADLGSLPTCDVANWNEESACRMEWQEKLLEPAFKGSLSAADWQAIQSYWAAVSNQAGADKKRELLSYVFSHPKFIYRSEVGLGENAQLNADEIIHLISYSITDSLPDSTLIQAGADGVVTTEELSANIGRLLAGESGKRYLSRFVMQWLNNENPEQLERAYLNDEVENSAYQDFLQSLDKNHSLSDFLSLAGKTHSALGIAFHPFYLQNRADSQDHVSAIFSGIAIRDRLLCQRISDPPVMATPMGDAKDQIEQRASASACHKCHQYIDPIGQNYLSFDGLGNSKAEGTVSASELIFTLDANGSYSNASELASTLYSSDHVARCFSMQLYRFLNWKPELKGDACHVNHLYEKLVAGESLEKVITANFLYEGLLERK